MAKKAFNNNQLFYLAVIALGLMIVPVLLGVIQKNQYQKAMAAFESQQEAPLSDY